jgi:Family of unknown function (DUF6364)
MPNVTISLDDKLVRAGRQYAKKQNTSMNALIRRLLEQSVQSNSEDWLTECFYLMDRANGNSKGKRWHRGELYDV